MSGNLERALNILTEAGIDHEDARFDISLIYSYLGDDEDKFIEAIKKRASGMPAAYITGRQAFYKEEYKVTPDVLIPRADTELLVETVLQFLGALDFPAGDVGMVPVTDKPLTSPRILDLCTGTGCVGISVLNSLIGKGLKPEVIISDISDAALEVANENVLSQAADKSSIRAMKIDAMAGELPSRLGRFDVITANPPYINSSDMEALDPEVGSFEPHLALAGGDDGLIFYPKIAELSHKYLTDGGLLAVEHGYDQAEQVAQTLMAQGFNSVKSLKDFGDNDRVTFGIKAGR